MRQRSGAVNGFLLFVIYGMFALFSLLLVLFGARVYRGVVTTGQQNTALRTSFSYIANKVHMCRETDGLQVQRQGEVDVLVLPESYGSDHYETRIYYADGALWEQFVPAEAPFDAAAGEKVADVEEFSIYMYHPGQLGLLFVAPDGTRYTMHLHYLIREE